MGCDIFAHLEYTESAAEARREAACLMRVFIPRDYVLFAILANVRNEKGGPTPVSLPKGLPADLSISARMAFEIIIDDELGALEVERYCTQHDAIQWIASGDSHYLASDESRLSDPDAHSMSWLDRDEVELAQAEYTRFTGKQSLELTAIQASMLALDQLRVTSRLVFWFNG